MKNKVIQITKFDWRLPQFTPQHINETVTSMYSRFIHDGQFHERINKMTYVGRTKNHHFQVYK